MKRMAMIVLALALLVPGVAWPEADRAQAAITSADFLKADGKFLRNQSGTGDIVTLRGTNLGGWLAFEDWMSPLGEFAMDRSLWTASASTASSTAGLALDGDETTRWTPGIPQASGQWFQVDLGTVTLFNRIYIDATGFAGQHPAGYRVLVSNDGTNWSNVASGAGTSGNTVIRFSAQVARYIRVELTESASASWSIAEFNVFSDPVVHNSLFSASASSTGPGVFPGMALDGNVATRWTSGQPQTGGETFEISLGRNLEVSRILIDAGPDSPNDYPRAYEIWGLTDGTWTKLASGYGTSRILYVEFWTARWMTDIRIVQTGSSGNWWSIAEVSVFSGSAFDRTGWTITASSTEPGSSPDNVKDGNVYTRWSTGAAQTNGQWIQVDMGASVTFNQIVLDTAKNTGDEEDYPRSYRVDVSQDGTNWTTVASGQGRRKATPINFAPAHARYFRIVQIGSSGQWWSIGELNVYLVNDDYSMRLAYLDRFGSATTEFLVGTHQDTWIQESDLDNLAAMGLNVVRLPIGWNVFLNLDGTWKASPWSKIDWLIQEAGERGIYVILDLHTVPGGGCPWQSCGRMGPNPNEFWTNQTYQDWVVDIWEAMADRYKGNPVVAGYDLINEPLIDYGEDADDVAQKSAYYDRLYDAVRAIDPDHVIFIAAFFGWGNIAPPAEFGWENVVYELHPYDMPGGKDWNAQNWLVENQLADVAAKQYDPAWNVPVLYGEYSLYHYEDVWEKFMSGLNALNVSWTNWTYKVRGDHDEGIGGYWGFYNSNPNRVPVINNDTPATIAAKLSRFATSGFQPNEGLIRVVTKHASGRPWMATVPLDQSGWTVTASSTEPGSHPANAVDWNSGTRWSTGQPQSPGQWFQIDMGSPQPFDQISIETRSSDRWDYPREYLIQVSNDGSTWNTVRSGKGFGWKQAFTLEPQVARYVRIVQNGSAPEWWSIAEVHVYHSAELDRTAFVATASSTEPGGSPSQALDGNESTRWSTGSAQTPGQWFEIDLGSRHTFHRILLDSRASTGDYPRGYEVWISDDAVNWTTVASGAGEPLFLIEFAPQTARYVRIVQTGSAGNWWSIHEWRIYGEKERDRSGFSAAASSSDPASPVWGALDGNLSTRWSTGAAQAPGQWFQVDLGTPLWFNHIVMDAGSSAMDYPRGFKVEVSQNGSTWRTVADGKGTGSFVAVNFPIVEARYIRVTLTESSGYWWSIHEFRVFE